MKLDFNITRYIKKLQDKNTTNYFHTFMNRSTLAVGLLLLKPGHIDSQLPHDTDEVYYILAGDGYLRIRNKDYTVKPNKIFFVKKNTIHYFHGNKKELHAIYFFGGPDS